MIFMSDGPVVNCGGVTPFKEFLQEQIKKTLSIGKIWQKPGQPAWAHQDEYSESLKGLEGMGVAIADIQAVQKEIGKRKRYIDITGNWLNHPNDYLARILAQVVIKTLGM